MELALFTRGAYIWPIYRNFESFITALGIGGNEIETPVSGPLYPARARTGITSHSLPPALDMRLRRLHRELYDALLRPVEVYENHGTSLAESFWPDMLDTAVDDLLSAFFYYFIRQSARDIPIAVGLNVLRAVFFNHEAVEPALWLKSSVDRVAAFRRKLRLREVQVAVPASSKLHDLAFVIVSDSMRPTGGPGWISGRIRRLQDGLCQATVEVALGPPLESVMLTEEVLARVDQEALANLNFVFGWRQEVAV
jgi:hypothetical protein